MIAGKCPTCGAKLTETRVSHRDGKTVKDAKGTAIKTTCSQCKRFIGYRPAAVKGTP